MSLANAQAQVQNQVCLQRQAALSGEAYIYQQAALRRATGQDSRMQNLLRADAQKNLMNQTGNNFQEQDLKLLHGLIITQSKS